MRARSEVDAEMVGIGTWSVDATNLETWLGRGGGSDGKADSFPGQQVFIRLGLRPGLMLMLILLPLGRPLIELANQTCHAVIDQ